MIPLRIIFGVTIILEGISRFTFVREHKESFLSALPHEWALPILTVFTAIEIAAGILVIPGLMARFAGFAIVIEMAAAIFVERIPLDFSMDLQTQILLVGIAGMMSFSGAGRYSIDHYLAKRILKEHPTKKWEIYCYAETPYTKWWE